MAVQISPLVNVFNQFYCIIIVSLYVLHVSVDWIGLDRLVAYLSLLKKRIACAVELSYWEPPPPFLLKVLSRYNSSNLLQIAPIDYLDG